LRVVVRRSRNRFLKPDAHALWHFRAKRRFSRWHGRCDEQHAQRFVTERSMMNSTKLFHTLLVGTGLALAGTGCASTIDAGEPAESTTEALSSCLPEIPAALAVPAGNKFAFSFHAEGVQIYACTANTSGGASWVFQAPQADLFGKHGRFAGTHYAGPTWESVDGSSVVGTKLAAATVDATAIPWLLLKAASHDGDGRMEKVTYIQRLETTAGLAPATGCDVSHLGAVANVDYTATYAFYKAQETDD
jgi:hypothetical protein